MSSCYCSLAKEIGLINPRSSTEDFVDREACHTEEDIDIPDADYWQDGDVEMVPSANDTGLPDHASPPPPFNNSIESQHRQLPGATRFVETYQGCAEMFPRGETFMSQFRNDQYAEQRQQNIYFPWASRQEWAFASWLLHSRLSMAMIDSLLSLEMIKNIPLSFRSAKELRTHAEILPSGPWWLCKTLPTEYPTKQPPRVFYRDPIECLQSLLSHLLFESHISFVPRRWGLHLEMQEVLLMGTTLLGVVLSSDKTTISVMSSNRMAHLVLISLANIDASLRSKTSVHTHLLIMLLPIAKFTHKTTQTLVGYRSFSEGISKLKQVTSCDHRAVQHYIIAAVAGSVPCQFLIAIHVLLNFQYLTQVPLFTTHSLERVSSALQEFHDNKEAIMHQGARANWQIPKLELLQSVVPSIHQSGALMQWSADVTKHAHVEEIKVPAHSGNNQNYYSQIARHLDWLDKCFHFGLATYIEQQAMDQANDDDRDLSGSDSDEQHEPDTDNINLSEYSTPTH
ncbi:hypothetical protein SCLCIDRAFT_33084 [Scleroderma citrinum Foug A]|uniref:Uncharacterized protein n=1 Tax=Scleroderma citrinum Foug A TaxID=1036808 RepID=A0A0C3CTK7_9AGAM|nr:hypothetical protein SCLCIDRAFT_33084 [Scleroderma citrinum Foug A]